MTPRIDRKFTLHFAIPFLLIMLASTSALGQAVSQYDRGTPPQHAAGVSSFGSYTTADLGNVNLSNGSLNMAIPLGTVGGRGFALPLTLNYSSKVWSVSKDVDYVDGSAMAPYASYGAGGFLQDWHNRLTPGWTVGIAPLLNVRSFGIDPLVYPGCGYSRYLTKLTVSLPDKGEIELRDDYTDGAPHIAGTNPNTGNCKWYDQYRGRRWHAADGSGTIFVSDVDNGVVSGNYAGVLITADGMRYRFENTPVPGGDFVLVRATSVSDRNGNIITITYPSNDEVDYTDQLNRVTKIKKNVYDPQTGQPLVLLVELPGYGGPRYYKVKAGSMNQNYRAGINLGGSVITGLNNPQNYSITFNGLGSIGMALFPESYCLFVERLDEQAVVNELILPDNRSLLFKYNEYGEVAEVQLPTGGKMQYDYEPKDALPTGVSLPAEVRTATIPVTIYGIDRALVARRTYADGTNLEGSWTYSYTSSTTDVRAFSASGTLLRNERHFFMPASRYIADYNDGLNGTGYSLWSTGLESRMEVRNASDAVMSATETDWTQRASVSWWTGYTQQQPANDNRINQTRRYLETGAMAKVDNLYDQYNNPTEVKEYDYNQTLKRRTVTSYLSTNNGFNYQTDDSIHLLGLPATQTIYDGSGNQVAQAVTEYDVYSNDGNRDVLMNYASVSQHDSNYGAAKTTRGNPTRTGSWLNTTGTYIYTYPRYDILGNVVSTKDARGNVSTISFADDFGDGSNPGTSTQNPATPTFALATLFTSPPPTPGAPAHTARSQYDYSTGLLTGFRDRNNVVTQTIYNDPFNRPTQVKSALGISGVETHATTYYAPQTVLGLTLSRNDTLTVSDLNSVDDASIRAWTVTDGYGRTAEAWSRDPLGDVKVVTVYDALGRVKQTSNPFRPTSESAAYSANVYDLAGRVTSVTTPDNAVVNTSYVGNTVTVTDQAGKSRKSVTDALGRLIEVDEDPAGLNYQTTYAYDVLDNLTTVTQGTQTRSFVYDSLKRLRSATNPESSTVTYNYDDNSNLIQKTDARGIVSTYSYDALNRNTTIDYSDTSSINPDVSRFYDGATNGKGRLWYGYSGGNESAGSNVEKTLFDSYDALGRPLVLKQLFKLNSVWSAPYQISRVYNLANVTSQTYPSGHSITYNYDSAGRLADKDGQNLAFTGNLGDGVLRTYSRGISYASAGQLKQEQFGTSTAVFNKLFYNSRQQLAEILASTVGGDSSWNRGKIINGFSLQCSGAACNATDNNGNLRKQEVYIPANDQVSSYTSWYQQYDYDALNRLLRVHEYTGTPSLDWQQEYVYDRWGNRTIHQTNTFGTGINKKNFTVNTANNRLGVPVGQSGVMSYDAAGNLTTDSYSGFGNRVYDEENKMTAAQDNSGVWAYYTYNADGQRTRRKINNQETWQVYGFEGELLTEYTANGAANQPTKEYGYRNGQLLISAEAGIASAPPAFADDFNDNSINSNSWTVYYPGSSPTVSEQSQQLQMTLSPNTAAYNGVYSNSTYDLTNKMVQVESVQAVSQAGWCENFLEVELNANNYFMVQVGAGSMLFRSRVNGVNDQTSIPFDGVANRFWRIRHDQSANQIYFETSANDSVWLTRKTVTPGFSLTSLRFHLLAGAYGTGNSSPGAAKYDNFKLLASAASASLTVPNAGFETPVLGSGNFQYAPSGGSWSFANGGGISGMNSPFTGVPSAAPDGVQVAFIQATGTVSQSISGFQASANYVITFSAIQRTNCCNTTGEDIGVYLDNTLVGTFHPSNTAYVEYSTAPFTTTTGAHTVKFAGLNATGDQTAFIDKVRITGTPKPGYGVQWLLTDQLGTPRLVFDESGALANVKRHDYLPFGEELFAAQGLRTAALGYSATDGVRQQFTSKERDVETGLDYFGARYYSSIQGRFTGADPLYYTASRPGDPQQFNLYSYVRNNPLQFIDPDGKDGKVVADTPDDLEATRRELKRIAPGTKVDANGKIHKPGFFRRMFNHLTGHGAGTSLVSRIVDSNKTVVIWANSDFGSTSGLASEQVRPKLASTLGVDPKDLGYIISFDTSSKAPIEVRNSNGTIETDMASPGEQLAHELVHADQRLRSGPLDATPSIHSFSERGVQYQEGEAAKEFRAVGYSGFTKSGDITENQIRRELGVRPRAAYNLRDAWKRVR
ncbi:MAG TPA: RHS repeat-associated core domain-containing protein [Pyrinomonadaceae bacterium]|nr:RHS repeat-associated core domain-containing protein [Pyrinomonadaceae bacterium]